MRVRAERSRGYATLIVLVLLGLVLALAMANVRILGHLDREIDRVDRLQTGTEHRSVLPERDAPR